MENMRIPGSEDSQHCWAGESDDLLVMGASLSVLEEGVGVKKIMRIIKSVQGG